MVFHFQFMAKTIMWRSTFVWPWIKKNYFLLFENNKFVNRSFFFLTKTLVLSVQLLLLLFSFSTLSTFSMTFFSVSFYLSFPAVFLCTFFYFSLTTFSMVLISFVYFQCEVIGTHIVIYLFHLPSMPSLKVWCVFKNLNTEKRKLEFSFLL